MAVADTSFLVDLLLGDEAALRRTRELARRSEPLWIPAPALHELYVGAALHAHPEAERARVEALEHEAVVLPFDAAAARTAGTFEGKLTKAGRRPGRTDVQVAAIALLHGERVLTRDRRFPRFGGLSVEPY